jgi:two-component system OmpR family sensor kinase
VRSRSWAQAERAVVRRAALRVGVLVGLVITVLVTLVGGVAYAVMVRSQDDQIGRELQYNAEHGAPATPPGCTWLFTLQNGVLTSSSTQAPAGFPLWEDLEAAQSVVERTVDSNGTVYAVRTQPRADGSIVQAVFDTRYQLADRGFLLRALVIAGLIGLFAAILTGALLGNRAVAPLAEALSKQRRFVTDASHELRTPITLAYTRAQVLLRRAAAADLPGEHRDGLDKLAGSLRGFGEIIDDLLLSARLAANQALPVTQPVDLADLAESAIAAETDRASERQLVLTVHRPGSPVLVTGIDSALRRAVGELLANAVNHTPPGGRIDLTVGRAADGRLVELTVADTGLGFEPGEAERLFDRFHRGPGGNERRYGLGLALLREVVVSHRGTVEAVGEPGRGATFTIRLPETREVKGSEHRVDVRKASL